MTHVNSFSGNAGHSQPNFSGNAFTVTKASFYLLVSVFPLSVFKIRKNKIFV